MRGGLVNAVVGELARQLRGNFLGFGFVAGVEGDQEEEQEQYYAQDEQAAFGAVGAAAPEWIACGVGGEEVALTLEAAIGRAVEKGESQGFMKILVDAESKKILGASILGTGGDEAIHCILDIMYADLPYTTLQRAMHIHPTVSELIPTVLGDLKPLE